MHVNRMRALHRGFPPERSTPFDTTPPKRNPLLLLGGGPFYRVECYVGLVQKDAPLMVRLAMIAVLLTWAPLLGLQVQHFGPLIAMWVVLCLLITDAPLAIFTPELLSLRRQRLHPYGALVAAYSRSFHQKWIERKSAKQETLPGSSDIHSVADMGSSFETIQHMQILPIDSRSLLQLIGTALLAMSALLLTVMSLQEIDDLLMKVVM